MKEIYIDILLNGNDEGVEVNMPDDDAYKLLALYQEAKNTVLRGIDEEDTHLVFDPWLKTKAPELYNMVINSCLQIFEARLNIGDSAEVDERFMSLERSADGICLSADNDICIASLKNVDVRI